MGKTVIRVIALLAVCLLLALCVPTATPLALFEDPLSELPVLFPVGSLPVTVYASCIALAALAACLITVALGRLKIGLDGSLSLCLAAIPCAVLGARLCYLLTNLQYIQIDLEYSIGRFLWQLWEGGYTLYGAVLGGTAGIWLYARATRRPFAVLLDHAAPGAAVALMIARLGEYFTSEGIGKFIDDEALQFFPLAVQDTWGDWSMAVFFYEALAAVVIAIVTWRLLRHDGPAAEVFIILLGLTQILLESWRMDELIRFGFVRFNQIVSAVLMAAVLALRIIRAVRARGWSPWQTVRIILFLAGIGVIIAIEFALDKSTIDNRLLYVVMAATLAVMGVSLLAGDRVAQRTKG